MSGQQRRRDPSALLEDLEFLDSNSTGATEAARRSEFPSAHAMEKWLERHDRYDLWLRMKARDPEGAHHQPQRKATAMTSLDTIAAVIASASRSSRARTRSKAAKVDEMVTDLRSLLEREEEEDTLREKARKDVERLERQLAAARAKLRGGGGSSSITVGSGISAADLRSWAAANGIECPAMGRVPTSVREAFETADKAAS